MNRIVQTDFPLPVEPESESIAVNGCFHLGSIFANDNVTYAVYIYTYDSNFIDFYNNVNSAQMTIIKADTCY